MKEPKVLYRDGMEREYKGLDDLVPDSTFTKLAQFGREYGPEAYEQMSDKEIMEVAKEMGYMVNSAEEARYLLKQVDPNLIRQLQPASMGSLKLAGADELAQNNYVAKMPAVMGGRKQADFSAENYQDILDYIRRSNLRFTSSVNESGKATIYFATADPSDVQQVTEELERVFPQFGPFEFVSDPQAGIRFDDPDQGTGRYASKLAQNNYVAVAKMLEACDKLIESATELQQQGSMSMPDIISQCEAMKEALMGAMGEMHMMDTPGTGPVPMGQPIMQEAPAVAALAAFIEEADLVDEIEQWVSKQPPDMISDNNIRSWLQQQGYGMAAIDNAMEQYQSRNAVQQYGQRERTAQFRGVLHKEVDVQRGTAPDYPITNEEVPAYQLTFSTVGEYSSGTIVVVDENVAQQLKSQL